MNIPAGRRVPYTTHMSISFMRAAISRKAMIKVALEVLHSSFHTS